ncbi:unnamed protein product, partial [marine sediment metagenome]
MSSISKKFEVRCPRCGVVKEISVPESLFLDKKFGTIKIKVPQGAVCKEHNFIVFISTKGNIIGYDVIDASVSLDQKEELPIDLISLTLDELINMFGFNCVAGFIHAKLFGYSSRIVRNGESNLDIEQINGLFDGLIPVRYRNSNAIIDEKYSSHVFPNPNYYYTMIKRKHAKAFIITNREVVIQVPWHAQIDFEKSILSNALGKTDENEQLKYLALYINQFISDVEFTKSLLENAEAISEKDLIKKLKEKLIVSTINRNRVVLIKQFISRRISTDLSKKI